MQIELLGHFSRNPQPILEARQKWKENVKLVHDSPLQASASRGLVRPQEGRQQGHVTASLHCSCKYWVAIRWEEGKDYQIHRNLLPETAVCNLETRRDLIFFYTSISAKATEKSPGECLGKQEVSGKMTNQHSSVLSETVRWAPMNHALILPLLSLRAPLLEA